MPVASRTVAAETMSDENIHACGTAAVINTGSVDNLMVINVLWSAVHLQPLTVQYVERLLLHTDSSFIWWKCI